MDLLRYVNISVSTIARPWPKLVGKFVIFNSVFPILHCSIYIMSTGDTRRSQSATFFNIKGKQEEEENQLLAKRKCEELTPTILVEQTSTSTFIGENEATETPFSGFTSSTDK